MRNTVLAAATAQQNARIQHVDHHFEMCWYLFHAMYGTHLDNEIRKINPLWTDQTSRKARSHATTHLLLPCPHIYAYSITHTTQHYACTNRQMGELRWQFNFFASIPPGILRVDGRCVCVLCSCLYLCVRMCDTASIRCGCVERVCGIRHAYVRHQISFVDVRQVKPICHILRLVTWALLHPGSICVPSRLHTVATYSLIPRSRRVTRLAVTHHTSYPLTDIPGPHRICQGQLKRIGPLLKELTKLGGTSTWTTHAENANGSGQTGHHFAGLRGAEIVVKVTPILILLILLFDVYCLVVDIVGGNPR